MLKKLLVGSVLLSASLASQAGIISVIDGADMAGIEVTASFADGSQELVTWSATDATSGSVVGSDWSLSLSGETFGDYDGSTNTLFGEWVLVNNTASGLTNLLINAGIVDVYFDNEESIEYTAGSEVGRPFVSSDDAGTTASFTDVYSAPDLFGTLNIAWDSSLAAGSSYSFLTDTDKAVVSEPATALVFLTGLLALVNYRRKS